MNVRRQPDRWIVEEQAFEQGVEFSFNPWMGAVQIFEESELEALAWCFDVECESIDWTE